MCSDDFKKKYLICIVTTKSENSNKNISGEYLFNI